MSIDLSKYEKMCDAGANPLEMAKQLYADKVNGIEFFKTLRKLFPQLSLEDTKRLSILASDSTIDEWAKPIIQALEELSKDESTDTES
jgi:hypothetical protein